MSKSFKKAIQLANSGQRYPVMSLVRSDPGMAAVISKLVPGAEPPTYASDGNRTPMAPNVQGFKETSERTSQNITDSQTVMQTLPDMELAAQILISSVLSPKDMTTTELTYSVTEGLMAPDVSAAMIAKARLHFEQVYKIKPLLQQMLRDILFETGSYAAAVIPENSLDEAINGSGKISMESLAETINRDGTMKGTGLLGPAVKRTPTQERQRPGFAIESLNDFSPDVSVDGKVTFESQFTQPVQDSFLTVTDNANLLKIPKINQKIREQRIVQQVGGRAMESISSKLNDRELSGLMYKDRQFAYKPISQLKTQEQLTRNTVGNPLVLHLPSESVIPVYVPGSVEQQVGFFVLIDADGNPVSKAASTDYYAELSNRLNTNGNGSFPSAMLSKVKSMMSGFDVNNRGHLDYSARAYGAMVEQDLLARLRNGVYGNGVALAKKEEVYRIMFSRALAKQHTQLLFIPIELMTYFAFRFNEQGVGKSLLDDMKILNSLRSMMLFSNVMASLRNSIGRTEVKLKLDESDPNPQKTIETAMHEIVRSRQQYFPLGTNSPTDLVDWLGRSGYEFTFEGHPGMPDVGVSFGEKNTNYVKPDTDLENELRKRAIMAVGISPETVDNSFNAEFATSVVTNNILLAKRVAQIQEQFTPQLADHLRKVMMNSEELINELREILETNYEKLKIDKKDEKDAAKAQDKTADPAGLAKVDEKREKDFLVARFLQEFIMNFEVALPRPNSVTLENQLAALKTYTEALDATLDAWISDKFFTNSTGGEVANEVNTIKEVLKAYYLRQWMAENGVMTELANLTMQDSDGKPIVDVFAIQADHVSALTKTLAQFMTKLQPAKDAADKTLAAAGAEVSDTPVEASPSDGGGGDFGGGGGSGGGDLGLGGLDDMPGLDDMGGPPAGDGSDTQTSETSEESSSSTTTDADGTTTTQKSESSSASSDILPGEEDDTPAPTL